MVQKWHQQAGHSTNHMQLRRKCDHLLLYVMIFTQSVYEEMLTVGVVITVYMGMGNTLKLFLTPLTSTWPHQNSDVGMEEGEY